MIWMNRCQDRFQFDPDDEVEAERFGQLSMTTISFIMEAAESALTKTALSHALKQKNALVETAKLLSGNLDILALFSATMTHAKDIMEVDRSTLFLYDKESHELWSKVADGAAPIRIPASAGIAGAVCTSRSVINIPDAYADSRFNQEIDKQTGYKTKTILAVPILSASGEMLGVLQLINKLTALGFSVEDVKLVDAFTSQIAIGISNCLAYEEVSIKHAALTRQMHQIEELLDVAVVLTQQIEFKPLCSAFKMCASRLAEASNTEVFVVDEAEGTIMQAAVAAGLEGRTYSISILCRENRPNMVSVAARCVAMAGVENDCSVLIRGQPLASLIGCILFVPLRSGRTGKLVGVLAAARDIGIFSKEQITWLTTLAEVGAIALESMQHYEQLDHKLARAELKTQRYQALLKLNRGICAGEGSTFKWDAFAATKQLLTCLDATSCTLYVIDWRQGVLHTRGSEHPYSRLAFPMNRGLLGMVARTGIPVNLEDATIHAAYDPVVDAAVSMFAVRHPSLLIVPVMGSLGQVLGVLQAVGKKSHEAAAVANQKKGPQKASQSRSFGKARTTSLLFTHTS